MCSCRQRRERVYRIPLQRPIYNEVFSDCRPSDCLEQFFVLPELLALENSQVVSSSRSFVTLLHRLASRIRGATVAESAQRKVADELMIGVRWPYHKPAADVLGQLNVACVRNDLA